MFLLAIWGQVPFPRSYNGIGGVRFYFLHQKHLLFYYIIKIHIF